MLEMASPNDPLPICNENMLAFGNGRSYGDVCLNENGAVILSRSLNRLVSFDSTTGRLLCESGVLLKDILDVCIPKGWFLPVVPGTQFVTVGGAIANDVHGKNHASKGTFGHHVLQFELLRSDGERKICSAEHNSDWFRSTIGGLGLTGMLTWVELQLRPVQSPYVRCKTQKFRNLDEFWILNAEAQEHWEYNVAWVDCLAKGNALGRGILSSAEHAVAPGGPSCWREKQRNFPFTPPMSMVNVPTLTAFNTLYYHKPIPPGVTFQHYVPYFFPLDSIRNWNRMYGKQGFYQYQCVIPKAVEREVIRVLLEVISQHKQGSFLAVLKAFSKKSPAGLLSFPREGTTLALDFPNLGAKTMALFQSLDHVVQEAGGALYPAKDARMSGDFFQQSFPKFDVFQSFIDPKFSSSFWRRVMR